MTQIDYICNKKAMNKESRFGDLSQYVLMGEFDGVRLYRPQSVEMGYHLSRYIQVQRQSLYASSGATPEVLQRAMDAILDLCNTNGDVGHRFTDIGGIANMVKYRLEYPVDEHCSIRVGCLLCFAEYEQNGVLVSENPDGVDAFFLEKKIDLAMSNPDAYAFFLTLGYSNIDSYKEHLNILEDEEYFRKRREVIRTLSKMG